jgi:DNA repair exonuclease SbcCD ATPase subunit
MTYRERRLRRAEKLRGWSETNEARSDAKYEAAKQIADGIPFGQPILVGHHSEGRHRRDLKRIDDGYSASFELHNKANAQASAADEIEAQAAGAIYSDDPDAIEALTAKIAKLEAERERRKTVNAEYRKAHRDELKAMSAYEKSQAIPYPSYSLSNLSGNITRCRQRLQRLQREKDNGPRDRMITARYGGECADCGAAIERGQSIRYNREQGARCVTCPAKEQP